MKTFLIIIFLSIFSTLAYAEKYYVYIEKIGIINPGQESGQNEKGDVIAVKKVSDGEPSKAERDGFIIIIVDMLPEEAHSLIEPQYNKNYGNGSQKVIKAREKKIKIENLNLDKQEKEIEKNSIINNIIVKPTIIPAE